MRTAFILAIAVLIGACAPTPGTSNTPLADTDWELRLVSMVSNDFMMPPDDEQVHQDHLLFGTDSTVSIRSCNTCNGLYAIEGNHIAFNRMACTRRACEYDRIDLGRLVGDHVTFRFDDGFLILEKIVTVDTTSLIFAPVQALEGN